MRPMLTWTSGCGRLTGELQRGPPLNIQNNVLVNPDDTRAIARIVSAVAPFPEAREAVIAALRDLDAESASGPALADHRDEASREWLIPLPPSSPMRCSLPGRLSRDPTNCRPRETGKSGCCLRAGVLARPGPWRNGCASRRHPARPAGSPSSRPQPPDARDVLVEGQSGIMAVSPPWFRPVYEPSKRRLSWPNGAIATTFSAEEPERLRGPQHDAAVCDELGSWSRPETWDMLQFGLRLGRHPRCLVATTPRPTKLIRELLAREGGDVVVTRGSTYENRENLAAGVLRPDHPQIRRHAAGPAGAQRRTARGHARRVVEPRDYRCDAPSGCATASENRGRDRSRGNLG